MTGATATQAFGAASIESMKKMVANSMKKIENAGAKDGVEASPTKAGGKKRKGTDDGDETTETRKKKRDRKPKSEILRYI